ncbi:MAG: PA14 domain-containing protein [Planctomycetota bacterium]|nr:PA14 domain-containing protein [Planctomycetota bacterium]
MIRNVCLFVCFLGAALLGGAVAAEFASQDIPGGSTTKIDDASYDVVGVGNDIWDTQDAFRFVAQEYSGNFDIRARVASLENSDGWAKAGLMVRQSSARNSVNAFMLASAGNGFVFQHRDTAGAQTNGTSGGWNSPPNSWVRLTRAGSAITGHVSSDGLVWYPVDSVTLTLTDPVLVGMAVTAHRNDFTTCKAEFRNVALAAYNPPVGTGDGLMAYYFNTNSLTGPLVLRRVDATVNNDWGGNAPSPQVNATDFSVRWLGQVEAQFSETYTFYTVSDDGVRLWVNDTLLVDNWTYHGPTENSGSIALAAGQKYDIKMEFFQGGGGSVAKLLWSSPSQDKQVVPQSQLYSTGNAMFVGDGTGLLGTYYNTRDLGGSAAATRVDADVNFDWGSGAPDEGMNSDNFSVRWIGEVQGQYTEAYTFYVRCDDGARLWVGDQLVIDEWLDEWPTEYASAPIALTAGGKLPIKLEYYENTGRAVAQLSWSSAHTLQSPVPQTQLYPGAGLTVTISGTSVVSPAFIEGQAWSTDGNPYTVTATGPAGNVPAAFISDNGWFVNVPLNPDGSPTPVSVTQSSTLVTRNSLVTWQVTDLAGKESSNTSIVIRKDDALLLTATGAGAVLTLDADGDGVVDYSGAPGDKFPFAYSTAGTFTAEAKIDGVSVGTLQVTVMDADLHKPIACQVGYTREKNVVVAPFAAAANVVFTPGDVASLAVAVKGPFDNTDGQGTALYLTALKRGTPVLVARLGSASGPIITYKEVDEYTIEQDARAVIVVNGTTEVGTVTLTMRPYIPELIYHFDMFASQSTFAGGLTYFEANSSTFQQVFDSATGETVGVFKFDIEAPPVAISACYRLWVTQISSEPQEVGRAGPTGNPTILKATVAKLILPVDVYGSLSITPTHSNTVSTIRNYVMAPVSLRAAALSWKEQYSPFVWTNGENDGVSGSTELKGTEAGYYDVYIGGTPFPNAIAVVKVEILTGDGAVPSSDVRVGITVDGRDRKKPFKAVVTPVEEEPSVSVTVSNSLSKLNEERDQGTIVFDIVGTAPSVNRWDQSIIASHAADSRISDDLSLTVVVPYQVAPSPHIRPAPAPNAAFPDEVFSGIVAARPEAVNQGTVPAYPGVPTTDVVLVTSYDTTLNVIVQDRWFNDIGDLYAGSPIEEQTTGGTQFNTNVVLAANSTYPDHVGAKVYHAVLFGNPVAIPASDPNNPTQANPDIATFIATGGDPAREQHLVQNIPVSVDGFALQIGIVNRTVDLGADGFLSIEWP